MIVKFKKLNRIAITPRKAYRGDAGFDLTAVSSEDLPNGKIRYGTGIAVEIPEGYVGLVFPRSSIFRFGLTLSNSVGVIDSGYRGEIMAVFRHTPGELAYQVGDRIAQLVIMPIPEIELQETDELSESLRGMGGYGSSGR